MQRLFSTFPGAWPGCALLLLRCIAAASLIAYAKPGGWFSPQPTLLLIHGLTIVAAGLLLAGLWTPVAGVTQTLLVLSGNFPGIAVESSDTLWAAIGLCVAMLGPGACSVDSRLFGRRRIEVRRRHCD